MEDYDAEIIQEFLVESSEILDQLDREFVELEKQPDDTSRLASIFRGAHTIKGTSGLLGYHRLESVTHVGESVLAKLRDGVLTLTPEITSVLLSMIDAIREMLTSIEKSGNDGSRDYDELVVQLRALLADGNVSFAGGNQPETAPPATGNRTQPEQTALQQDSAVPAQQAAGSGPAGSNAATDGARGAVEVEVERCAEATPQQESQDTNPRDARVRVHVELLDRLMNLVGELVLSRNQIVQWAGGADNAPLAAASQRLNVITTELQEGVMKTRMQPIGNVWAKFPRIVRDLAVASGKEVQLDLVGRETELDRTIIEAIRDPLTHIVRNSVDHGLETPDARRAAGKPGMGTISFRAFHEGGMVNIEVNDDGRGINADAVRNKAVERGMLTQQAAAKLSDREATLLVFHPGFSTAEKVTSVSGRGVGMDVVKTSIERIGGTVDLYSRPGLGTSIRVKIPLTLAIIPALVVSCGEERYAIPQVNLVEMVRVSGQNGTAGPEYVRDAPVYRLRGRLLPLVFLREVFEQSRTEAPPQDFNIVVVQADGRPFGLVVDSVEDTEEIVVKPLSSELKSIPVFAGATIMGDGRVALILDTFGIAATVGMASGEQDATARSESEDVRRESVSLLVLETLSGRRMALPLAEVDRLEEVEVGAIERVGGRYMLQYRGGVLPIYLAEELIAEPMADLGSGTLQVVVLTKDKHTFGLVVRQILDAVEQDGGLYPELRRPGTLGCVVVQGQVTEVLDLDGTAGRLRDTRELPKSKPAHVPVAGRPSGEKAA
jgi:two-component system, chemotaxis family, sensor kinase CheA